MAEQTVIPGTNVLEVRNLNKKYPSFELRDVSFTIKPGQITGFIGRNGAGKSTTLNSIFNMIPRDSGDISYFGLDFKTHERDIKQRVGFVSSGISYYPRKTIKTIASVTSSFFNTWDDAAYLKYMDMFGLDEKKTPSSCHLACESSSRSRWRCRTERNFSCWTNPRADWIPCPGMRY